jgi:hypothetical protein
MLYHEEYKSPKPDRYMNIELKFEIIKSMKCIK